MRSLKDIRKQSRYMQARQGSAAWAGLFMSAASAPGSTLRRQCQPTLMQGLRPRAQLFWRRVAIVGDDIVRDRQPACPRSLCRHDTPYGRLRQPRCATARAICVAGSQSTTQMRSRTAASAAATRPATAPRTQVAAARRVGAALCLIADQRMQHGFQPLPHRDRRRRARIQARSSSRPRPTPRRRTPARSRAWPNRRQRSAPARSHRCPPRTRPIRPACPPRATCPSRCPRQTYFEYAHRFVHVWPLARRRHARWSAWQQPCQPGLAAQQQHRHPGQRQVGAERQGWPRRARPASVIVPPTSTPASDAASSSMGSAPTPNHAPSAASSKVAVAHAFAPREVAERVEDQPQEAVARHRAQHRQRQRRETVAQIDQQPGPGQRQVMASGSSVLSRSIQASATREADRPMPHNAMGVGPSAKRRRRTIRRSAVRSRDSASRWPRRRRAAPPSSSQPASGGVRQRTGAEHCRQCETGARRAIDRRARRLRGGGRLG